MARPQSDTPSTVGWQARLAAAELVLVAMEGASDFDAAMDKSRTFKRLQGPDRGFARAMAVMMPEFERMGREMEGSFKAAKAEARRNRN